jgi:DNA-binding response OmpR family regulator
MKILVVEDDRVVAEALRVILSDRMYAVEVAHDGQAGLDFIEAFDYDLLLLDAILPKLDGISICRHARSRGYLMPILLLTSKDSRHDRAIGLDAGADDYVVKPFDPEELSARIRALLRRGNDRMQPVLTWEDLTLNPCNYEVTYQHQLLSLTPKEYALLELFLRHSRQLFSCGAILGHLWTYEDAPSEEAVRTHIKGLRHKLKAAGAPTDFVETVYGIGYRLRLGDPTTDSSQERLRQGEPSFGDRQIGVVPVASAAPLEPLLVPSAVMVSEGERFSYRETTSTRQTEWIDPLGTSAPTIEDTTTSVSQTADADLVPSGCANPQQSPPGDPSRFGSPSERLRQRLQHWAGEPAEVATSNSLHFLTEIWNRHHEQMLDRVASIDRAFVALRDRCLALCPYSRWRIGYIRVTTRFPSSQANRIITREKYRTNFSPNPPVAKRHRSVAARDCQ